ncbi:MAG: pyridoxamine 5'-phosphate oxidase [Rhodothermales bacterium]|nr:pyridoxamine 5'-phosphate oxidase [Rhodothermales bacterium]MBO6780788.1 pyridoxamine 5'-phosphate oxidase [Rhodothermales bacterium]
MKLKTVAKHITTLGKGVARGIDPELAGGGDPYALFRAWFREAEESGLIHPEAMALATASADGQPSVRIVLLKEVDAGGFVFYTNYESRKAGELDANPHASVAFHWAPLERQVRVEGTVERVSREQSEAYFHSRPRGSQIGAWASRQSRELPERGTLEDRVAEFTGKFDGQEVPLPDHWGGYRIRPSRIEFWQGRASRLHDRLIFEPDGDDWTTHRLYP